VVGESGSGFVQATCLKPIDCLRVHCLGKTRMARVEFVDVYGEIPRPKTFSKSLHTQRDGDRWG